MARIGKATSRREGLSEKAALRALKRASLETMYSLNVSIRAKKLQRPISTRMLDSRDHIPGEITDRGMYRYSNPAPESEVLFYLIGEDFRGRKVCSRIELMRQIIQ